MSSYLLDPTSNGEMLDMMNKKLHQVPSYHPVPILTRYVDTQGWSVYWILVMVWSYMDDMDDIYAMYSIGSSRTSEDIHRRSTLTCV